MACCDLCYPMSELIFDSSFCKLLKNRCGYGFEHELIWLQCIAASTTQSWFQWLTFGTFSVTILKTLDTHDNSNIQFHHSLVAFCFCALSPGTLFTSNRVICVVKHFILKYCLLLHIMLIFLLCLECWSLFS